MSWALRASMMQGHALRLKRQHSATSTDEDENKENSTPVQLSSRSQTSSHLPMHVDMMVGLMESQRKFRSSSLRTHLRTSENNHLAREAHEFTMSALLTVIREGCWPQFLERFFQRRVSWLVMPGTRQSSHFHCFIVTWQMWMLPMPSGSGEIKLVAWVSLETSTSMSARHKHSAAWHGCWRCFQWNSWGCECSVEDSIVYGVCSTVNRQSNKNKIK